MKIKDICTSVTDGSHNPPQGIEKSEYMMLSSKNIFDDEITFDEPRFLSEKDFEREHKRTQIAVGDVLLTIVGTVGRTAVVDEDMPAFALQRSVAVLHPKNDVCLPRFLMYALRGKRTYIENRAKGVAQKGIYLKEVSDIDIYIPDISNQEIIINKLDKVNTIIKLRQEELLALDNLIKARFVEMFSDCTNMISLSDLCLIITDGTHQSPKFQHEGIPFILVSNLSKNTVTYDTDKFISAETYKELYKRTPIEIGDILLSTVGSYGHPAVVVEDRKFLFQRHIAYLKPKSDILNSYYMHGALLSPGCQRQIEEKVKGIAQKTLNLSEIRKIRIPVPSLDLQKQYADFVHQVNKSKFDTMTFAPIYAIINLYLHTYFYQGRR